MTAREMSATDAAALVRATDTMAVPLGPGAPTELLHALGKRDDWEQLEVFGALLLDLYTVFTKPGVALLQRLLRTRGAAADRRRRGHRVPSGRLPPVRDARRALRTARHDDDGDTARRARLHEPLVARGRDGRASCTARGADPIAS